MCRALGGKDDTRWSHGSQLGRVWSPAQGWVDGGPGAGADRHSSAGRRHGSRINIVPQLDVMSQLMCYIIIGFCKNGENCITS